MFIDTFNTVQRIIQSIIIDALSKWLITSNYVTKQLKVQLNFKPHSNLIKYLWYFLSGILLKGLKGTQFLHS